MIPPPPPIIFMISKASKPFLFAGHEWIFFLLVIIFNPASCSGNMYNFNFFFSVFFLVAEIQVQKRILYVLKTFFFWLKMCLSKICGKRHLQKKEVSEFSPGLENKLHYTLWIMESFSWQNWLIGNSALTIWKLHFEN